MTRNERLQLIGWILFVLCAIFYIITSIESRSLTSLLGSLTFLFGCFFFIIPLLYDDPSAR